MPTVQASPALAAGPGRPREFDVPAALAAALGVFWDQGYEATSLDDLTRAMGISRSSFYACFGSKRDVLIAAIARYSDERLDAFARIAAAGPEPRAAVRTMVRALADPEGGPHGCFLVNCIAELAPHDPDVQALSQRHLDRVERIIAESVARAVPGRRDPAGPARALLSLALGATMLRKAGFGPERLDALLAEGDHLIT